MPARKYTLDFVSTADTSGAAAAEKAVTKVGDAAAKSGDKLDNFEKEFKAKMAALKSQVEASQKDLREAGTKAGQGTGEGMGDGLQLAANMHLVGQAWDVGSMIGKALGEVMIMAYEGTVGEKLEDALAPYFESAAAGWSARLRASVQQEMRGVYDQIKRDQEAFWRDYMNSAPKNAGDWLIEIKAQADAAAKAIRNVAIMQAAEGDDRVAQIEADAAEKKDVVDAGPGTAADKTREKLRIEAEKEFALLEERNKRRAEAVQNEQAEAALKAKEVERLRAAEASQTARYNVEKEAEEAFKAEIESRKQFGQRFTDEDQAKFRDQAYQQASKKFGENVMPGQDEAGELKKIRDQRFAAEKAAQEAAVEAEMKKRENALREATDIDKTVRKTTGLQRDLNAVPDEAVPDPDNSGFEGKYVKPGKEQTPEGSADDLRRQLGAAAKETGDAGLKMALEQLKSRLADGGSAQELKEAAALMERVQMDNNSAVAAMAQTMRASVDAQRSSLAQVQAEMAALKASMDAWKSNAP